MTSSVLSYFEESFTSDGDAPLSGHSTGQIARDMGALRGPGGVVGSPCASLTTESTWSHCMEPPASIPATVTGDSAGSWRRNWFRYFGTKSLGFSEPPPNRNFSISATKKARALGSIGVRRFSLISIV
jgi:hypothetical protein